MSNPNTRIISQQAFYGGRSSDASIGPSASFSYDQALEFRRNPSQLTVLPGPRKISAGVVNDLILNICQVQSGTRYALGDTGYLYKIDTSNTVTFAEKLADGSDGMLYRSDSDAIYLAGQSKLYRYYPISGTPDIDVTYGPSRSADSNAYRTGGTSTYTVPTAINENDYCSFQPDIEPFYSVKVNIITKGTGDWTLTLHDGLNSTLATSTITNANLTTGHNEFVFSSQVRALVKPNARTYHFHLTSTVADGTVACSTSSNLNTADFELWAHRLVDTTNNLHPIAQFLQYTCIGNGNYLAVWEPLTASDPPNTEFKRHRLTFPSGFEVCGLAPTDEYLVIACEKRSTSATRDFQEGKLFIWDGLSETYNQIIDVSGGAPQGMLTFENYPYFFVNGTLCAWAGGKNIIKIRTLADTSTDYLDTTNSTTVYPNMMTVRDNLLHVGFPSSTTSTAIEHGVYTWGSLDKNYPSSFGYGYVISTQTKTNTGGTLQLGCVRNFGDQMYISWKDGTNNYGLDIVDSYCDPAPTFKLRSRRFDAGAAYKEKLALRTVIDAAAVPSGVTITPVYELDDAGEVSHESTLTVGGTRATAPIPQGKFKRIVYGFDGTCTGGTSPTIYVNALAWDPLIDQRGV